MDSATSSTEPDASDLEFAVALRIQTERDADAVAELLIDRGFVPIDGNGQQSPFTADQLLGIALSLRLRRWELNQISVHVGAGIPTSDEVLQHVSTIKSDRKLRLYVSGHWVRTILLFHDCFIWSTESCDLSVDIAVVADEDEAFMEAIVDFLSSISSNRMGEVK